MDSRWIRIINIFIITIINIPKNKTLKHESKRTDYNEGSINSMWCTS